MKCPVKLKYVPIYLQICREIYLRHERLLRDLNIRNQSWMTWSFKLVLYGKFKAAPKLKNENEGKRKLRMALQVKSVSHALFCQFRLEVCVCLLCMVRNITVPVYRDGLPGAVIFCCRLWHISAWSMNAWTSLSLYSTMYLRWLRRFKMKLVSKLFFWYCA